MIELILIAQLNTTPQGVNNHSSGSGNSITAPNRREPRSQFIPPVQNPNFVPKLQIEPFPKQPSLTDYLEYQRRNGNHFGEPRIQRR